MTFTNLEIKIKPNLTPSSFAILGDQTEQAKNVWFVNKMLALVT